MSTTDTTPDIDPFFDEQSEQSQVKGTIVSKYFWAWAKVIISSLKANRARNPNPRIAYIDLFAGPGRYKDGASSTPLKVLETAINDPDMREMLVAMFNDADGNHAGSLQGEIAKLPGIETMKHAPRVSSEEVGQQVVDLFEKTKMVPTLFFVDPWGYKGLSLRLVNSVLQHWGCDCVFFFNYNRINMGLTNPKVKAHMAALFGEDRVDEMRAKLENLDPESRELMIVEELAEALKAMGGNFVLPFRFVNAKGTRTSHHLIFVSKHFRGYEIMKGIMAKESSLRQQGVASFAYNPADIRFPVLFELARPLDELCDLLTQRYKGQTLTMKAIYEDHNVGTPFISSNYKDALKKLEADGRIKADPAKRRADTFADNVKVTFPAVPGLPTFLY